MCEEVGDDANGYIGRSIGDERPKSKKGSVATAGKAVAGSKLYAAGAESPAVIAAAAAAAAPAVPGKLHFSSLKWVKPDA